MPHEPEACGIGIMKGAAVKQGSSQYDCSVHERRRVLSRTDKATAPDTSEARRDSALQIRQGGGYTTRMSPGHEARSPTWRVYAGAGWRRPSVRVFLWAGCGVGLWASGCLAACEQQHRKDSEQARVGVGDHAVSQRPSPAASSSLPPASSAPSAAASHGPAAPGSSSPGRPLVACKAVQQRGLVSLTTLRTENEVYLRVQGELLYALAYDHAMARSTLKRVRRDGEAAEVVGHYSGLGPPTSFVVFEDGAYFWRKRSIFRVDLGTREAAKVADDVERAFAVSEQGLFALRHGDSDRPARLLRMSGDGASSTVAALPKAAGRGEYGFRHVTVDDTYAFISDWASRCIYRVTLASGSVEPLVEEMPFPLRSIVDRDRLVFHAANGVYGVPRGGGKVERLSEIGMVPYSTLVADADDFWVYTAVRFTDTAGLYRIPKAGGEAQPVKTFGVFLPGDPLHDAGFRDLAVDDQCLYFAREGHRGTPTNVVTLIAQKKPARGSR